VQDAAIERAMESDVLSPTISSADVDWLYEFEQISAKNARQKRSSVEEAVDLLIATGSV
ncbi:hypothetical protein LCGC14_2898810, partial [marine sediment metagenome]